MGLWRGRVAVTVLACGLRLAALLVSARALVLFEHWAPPASTSGRWPDEATEAAPTTVRRFIHALGGECLSS